MAVTTWEKNHIPKYIVVYSEVSKNPHVWDVHFHRQGLCEGGETGWTFQTSPSCWWSVPAWSRGASGGGWSVRGQHPPPGGGRPSAPALSVSPATGKNRIRLVMVIIYTQKYSQVYPNHSSTLWNTGFVIHFFYLHCEIQTWWSKHAQFIYTVKRYEKVVNCNVI